MSCLNDGVRNALKGLYEGLYTLDETYWRLLEPVQTVSQIDELITLLPGEIARAWIEWARSSFSKSHEGSFVLGRGSLTPHEQKSIEAIRAWFIAPR